MHVSCSRPRRRLTRVMLAVVGALVLIGAGAAIIASASTSRRKVAHQTAARAVPRPQVATLAERILAHPPAPNPNAGIAAALPHTPFITAGVPRHRVIALTFDDGPSPYTPRIINVLSKMHAPATFFIVGQQLTDFGSALRDELSHHFAVGDHTENHPPLVALSAEGQYGQIHDAAARMRHLGAPAPVMFRPPYGVYNSQTLATLRAMHMMMVLWSIDPGDWRRPGTGAIVGNVLANARPGRIVEMHDGGGDRSQTVAALPAIINGLRREGYQLVTVPELVKLDPPPAHQPLPRLGAA